MTVFVLELNDRCLCLARGGQVLSSAPSIVFDGALPGPGAGTNAWHELRSRPTSTSSRHLSTVLTQSSGSIALAERLLTAELQMRLAEQPIATGERVWIVAPARVEPKGLEALLRIGEQLNLAVAGFADSATVTAASLEIQENAIVLELGLHHAAATAVARGGAHARHRRSVLTERGGYIELLQAWLDLVGTTMVKRTRFDPLHDAATEQQLFSALPGLALEAANTGSTIAVVTKGQEQFEVNLTRDQFAQAAEPIYRAMISLLHQLRPAGSPVTLVVPAGVAELPGVQPLLEQFAGCELVRVADGFVASAVSLLELPEQPGDQEGVRWMRRLPLAVAGASGVAREELGQARSGRSAPSHVLFEGRAYSLATDTLVVGRAPDTENAPSIQLNEGLAGVSRRHCTFLRDGDEQVLLDHSTFGTFVNAERVQERVRVRAGDRVRVGDPGVELALIAVGEVTTVTQQP